MNKTLNKFLRAAFWCLMFDGLLLGYAGLIPGVDSVAAQTILSNTTLSSAVPGGGPGSGQSVTTTGLQTFITVASATNIVAPGPDTALIQTPAVSSFLFVDRELMDVRGVSVTTILVCPG